MATPTTEQNMPRAFHMHDTITDEDGDVTEDSEPENHNEEEEEQQAVNYRSSITSVGISRVVDPRAKWVQEWNRVFLLVCGAGLFVDPLFFYALSISDSFMCLFIDGWFAVTVTVLRCMTDALHLWHIFLRFKMAKRNSFVISGDTAGADARCSVALAYLKSRRGFFFDLFVILPIPQIVLWVAIPSLLEQGSVTLVMTILLIVFLFQYLPKIYHSVCHLRRTQNLSGYIFGTVWWGIALNMIAYFVASHAAGACWYLLGIQRATKCLKEQCLKTNGCGIKILSCHKPIYYGSTSLLNKEIRRMWWADNREARSTCINGPDNFNYGAYKWTVQLVTNDNRLEKILFPIFWGLMTLSTFGNLESTTDWLEVVFNIIVLTSGLLLVTMLIGNIKVNQSPRSMKAHVDIL
ncbi:Cyclic nucleotide-gated ion channel 4, variant 2 [Lathyrus oleraceus]|uniref:Cyclic nucleotide-gated ion channel 4, variant 2 n=1 Tax=Pisum sativum TaxID=3888 RepID=A0A9D4XKT8_PEA|nr:Cyclic nucleotide-gated ion channel 4, variant 2 [Pisum sativum]